MIKNILALFACVVLFSAPLKASSPEYKYFALQNWSEDGFDMAYLQWSSELSENGFMWIDWGAGNVNSCVDRGIFSIGGGMKFGLGDSSTFDLGLGYTGDALVNDCLLEDVSDSSTDILMGLRFAISDSAEGYARMKTSSFTDGLYADRTETGLGVVFYLGPFVGVEIGVGTTSYDGGGDLDFTRLALRFKR